MSRKKQSNGFSWSAEEVDPAEVLLRQKFRICMITGISLEEFDSLTPYETGILVEEFKKLNKKK